MRLSACATNEWWPGRELNPRARGFSVRVKSHKFLERRAIRAQPIDRRHFVPETNRETAKEHEFGGQAEKLRHGAMP